MKKFIIFGEPKGKVNMRPVQMGKHLSLVSTPENRNYMSLVRDAWFKVAGDFKFNDDPLIMRIFAYYPIPKATSKKKRDKMLFGQVKPNRKPDCDNISKVICDALNGIAFSDDSHIACLRVSKEFAETPRVEVEICSYYEEYLVEKLCIKCSKFHNCYGEGKDEHCEKYLEEMENLK